MCASTCANCSDAWREAERTPHGCPAVSFGSRVSQSTLPHTPRGDPSALTRYRLPFNLGAGYLGLDAALEQMTNWKVYAHNVWRGCLGLAGLLLLLGSVYVIGLAIVRVLRRATEDAVIGAGAGLFFAIGGLGLFLVVSYGMRECYEERRLRAAHPGETWLWDADWCLGRSVIAEMKRAIEDRVISPT